MEFVQAYYFMNTKIIIFLMKLNIIVIDGRIGDSVILMCELLREYIELNLGRIGIDQSLDLMYEDRIFDYLLISRDL